MDSNKEIQAYSDFSKTYELRNPKPVEIRSSVLTKVALFFITVSSIIVSGFHTIPTFREVTQVENNLLTTLVSIASFTMIELALITLGYLRVRNSKRHGSMQGKINLALLLIGFIAVSVNFRGAAINESLFTEAGFGSTLKLIVVSLVGISAPILAFLSGDILAILTNNSIESNKRSTEEWREGLNRSWDRNKYKFGIETPKQVKKLPEPEIQISKPMGRNPNAKSQAKEYIKNIPELYEQVIAQPKSLIKIDNLLEVVQQEVSPEISRGSVYNAMQEIRRENTGD